MKGFSDWSSGQTKIPKWREIFDYFGLGEALGPTSAGYKEREEQAGKLLEWLRVYCEKKELSLWEGTRAFLNDGALYGMDLGEIMGEKEESLEGVRLMTLHASKGLEFHRVYLIGMNQGLIPLRCKTMEQEEEERRLFFVGMTRAKEELELSYYVNPRREFPEKEAGIFWEYLRSFWTGRKTSGREEGKKISGSWEEKSGKNCGGRKRQKRNWLQTRGIQMLSQRAEEKNFRRNQMKGKLEM